MNWEKRKAEIKTIILGCIEGNQDWPDDMTNAILAQEQSMIAKLEADNAELLNLSKEIAEYLNRNKLNSIRPTSTFHKLLNQIVQKMEEK
jgi:hypothetical protein